MYPDVMNSSPCRANGVGMLMLDIPVNSHSSLPVRSYDRTLVGARRHDLGAAVVLPDERRRPVGALVAIDPPDLGAGPLVVRGEERLLVVVVDDVDAIAVEHRRRGVPQPLRVLNGPIGFDHTGLPFMSNTNRPTLPK